MLSANISKHLCQTHLKETKKPPMRKAKVAFVRDFRPITCGDVEEVQDHQGQEGLLMMAQEQQRLERESYRYH